MHPKFLPTTTEGKLDRLVEEMGEVLLAFGKCKRFGPATRWDPKAFVVLPPGRTDVLSNDEELRLELDDLIHAASTARAAINERIRVDYVRERERDAEHERIRVDTEHEDGSRLSHGALARACNAHNDL